jgi:hypothetical protein
MIERPEGASGRHFNLKKAMNLDGKDTVYKNIRVSISISPSPHVVSSFPQKVQNH